jgi:hypothetical protein
MTLVSTNIVNTNPWVVTSPNQSPQMSFNFAPDGITLRGGDLSSAKMLYPTDFYRVGRPMRFHFAIWERIFADEIRDYGFAVFDGMPGSASRLVFGSDRSHRQFTRWWRAYRRRFGGDSYKYELVPTFSAEKRACGTVYRFAIPSEHSSESVISVEMYESWEWIVRHSQGKVWRTPGCWVFQRASDAVAARLCWS